MRKSEWKAKSPFLTGLLILAVLLLIPASNPQQEELTPEPTPAPTAPAVVYITQSGSKYHRSPVCSSMKEAEEVSFTQALEAGYEPCGRCCNDLIGLILEPVQEAENVSDSGG